MEIFIAFIFAFIATIAIIPFIIPLSHRLGLIDDPAKRPHPAHIQKRIVPRAGGIAIYISIILAIILFIPITEQIVGIILGASVLLLIGLLDDKFINFNPYIRLVLLFAAAGFPVLSGVGVSFVTNPFSLLGDLNPAWGSSYISFDQFTIPIDFLGTRHLLAIADLFAFLWIVTLTQIINWSKGVDGQMPGITLVAALTLGLVSLKFFLQGDIDQLNVAKICFIVAGTSLGFLIFNWYPAKIFPGFSGSTILAFMLAVLAIMSGAKLATAILVLAVPSADFIYTFFRRMLSGHSPVWGDRGHLHHKLLDLGWSHQTITLFYIAGSAIFGLLAIVIDIQSKAFIVLGILTGLLGLILWINSFGDLSEQ